MEKEYLDLMAKKQAIIIFESELYAKGCPNSFDELDRLKEHSFDYLDNLGYNFREKKLIEKELNIIFRDYRNNVSEITKAYI